MDLRTKSPRSVHDKLGGYAHLARMLDKCRATSAGTQGEYIYPCPMDKRLLEFARVSPEQFTEMARGRSDEEVARSFKQQAAKHTDAEIESWNRMMLTVGPDTDEKWAYFRSTRDALDRKRTDITAWADLLDLEEGRPVPKRTVTSIGA
jgi:uncharacterized protein DUF5069